MGLLRKLHLKFGSPNIRDQELMDLAKAISNCTGISHLNWEIKGEISERKSFLKAITSLYKTLKFSFVTITINSVAPFSWEEYISLEKQVKRYTNSLWKVNRYCFNHTKKKNCSTF